MASPRVSVIIPVHNAEKYLEQCLDSVLSQTEKNIEVICVNDSSTDNSQEILERYSHIDQRIILLNAECHCAGTARNFGMDKAQGEYLSFLDADDFFELDMLKETANSLDETGADIVVYESWLFDTVANADRYAKWILKTDLLPDKPLFSWRDIPNSIFNAFGNYTWNKLFRRSLIQDRNIRFQEIPRTNDLLFTCVALIEAKGITTIKKPFAHYRINTSTSLQASNDKSPTAFIDAFFELHHKLCEMGLDSDLMQSFLAHLLDGVLANANSVKTLESLIQIKRATLNQIEPRFELLKQRDYILDDSQLNQYKSLLTLELDEYLLVRTHCLASEKNELARYAEWTEWKLWQASTCISELEERLNTSIPQKAKRFAMSLYRRL